MHAIRILGAASLSLFAAAAAEPIGLHPDNPHYFSFRGKPTVLITSAEHYGAVLNGDFDFVRYLDTLKAAGLNLTRTFAGVYYEVPGDFGIARNTLAPKPSRFVGPYARSTAKGALDGLNKFNLDRWNAAYFDRLKRFLRAASDRGIVVELTLFCVYYSDRMWNLSPLNPSNNTSGMAAIPREEVLAMKHPGMVAVQEAFVRKIVQETREFDNVLYEICNEPYIRGLAADDWQSHIAKVIRQAEESLAPPQRHLTGWNAANFARKIDAPDPNVSYYAFHYARPPVTVAQNYSLARPIGMNETGFDGTLDAVYRMQAWDFLMAGGAMYNNLDYSFTAGNEDGAFPVPGNSPGGGSAELRLQLRVLADFFAGLDFVKMRPANDLVTGGLPGGYAARALEQPGQAYAVYVHSGRVMEGYRPRYVYRTGKTSFPISLNLPAGKWRARWTNTRTGKVDHEENFEHPGGHAWVPSPEFTEDIALVVARRDP
ncbi:MAG: hypothetical protein R2762_18190 [Bryobacteraceae bacterium]